MPFYNVTATWDSQVTPGKKASSKYLIEADDHKAACAVVKAHLLGDDFTERDFASGMITLHAEWVDRREVEYRREFGR